jgi:response regulator RpfG family c-di-GMP phosphodiesterase
MTEKILLVDDEQNLLDSIQRLLRKDFALTTAAGGDVGLEKIGTAGPFSVIVSDMRMPGMDGIQFLREARRRSPDSVRLMLTGNADLQTAIDAVNEGAVFRFLLKPASEEILKGAFNAALYQYRLIMAERELLEQTLHGSVKSLTEILALVSPAAFSRASRIYRTVQTIVEQLHLEDGWSYQLAALLSQIGCVALNPETVEAVYSGQELPAAELARFQMHPSIAYDFLHHIPRLETVAAMVAGQYGGLTEKILDGSGVNRSSARLGAEILSLAIEFDRLSLSRITKEEVIAKLTGQKGRYSPLLLTTVEHLSFEPPQYTHSDIYVREMTVGMILEEDFRAPNGMLLIARHQEITYPLLVRIRNFCEKFPSANKVSVKVARTPDFTLRNAHEPKPVSIA